MCVCVYALSQCNITYEYIWYDSTTVPHISARVPTWVIVKRYGTWVKIGCEKCLVSWVGRRQGIWAYLGSRPRFLILVNCELDHEELEGKAALRAWCLTRLTKVQGKGYACYEGWVMERPSKLPAKYCSGSRRSTGLKINGLHEKLWQVRKGWDDAKVSLKTVSSTCLAMAAHWRPVWGTCAIRTHRTRNNKQLQYCTIYNTICLGAWFLSEGLCS